LLALLNAKDWSLEVVDLWRGLVRVTPKTFWMRETTTDGRFADFFGGRVSIFAGGASMLALTKKAHGGEPCAALVNLRPAA
jgi:hypothetical protein